MFYTFSIIKIVLVRVTLTLFLYLLLPCNSLFASENSFSFNLLNSKQLEIGEYKLNHSEHSPVISDENENFYIKTDRGFNKYNSEGDLVFEFILTEDFLKLSNLVYTNNKILFISKQKPGNLYVVGVSGKSPDLLQKVKIYEDTGDPPKLVFTPFGFSDIGLDGTKTFLYFASHNNPRAYKYDIQSNQLNFKELAENSGYVLGTHVSAPIPLGDSSVLFSTNEGFIQKYINENIAATIFTEKYLNKYAFLNSRSDYTVPLSASENYAYFLYDKYICKFGLSRGVNEVCEPYADSVLREGSYVTNLSNHVDTNYLGFTKKYSEQERTGLAKINKDLVREWDRSVFRLDKGGVKGFEQGVLAVGDDLFAYDDSGNLMDTFIPAKAEDSGLKTASIFSPTQKGNYYVFYNRIGIGKSYPFIYHFSGNITNSEQCSLPYYCETTPKHRPVIFVHGLGGHYQQWFDGQNAKLRAAVLDEYKKDDAEFPDEWAHAYSYGINFNQEYDYQGKIEDISTNMHSVVEKLATEHKLAGGEGKVDIVAYSLGGLVARHYILEKTGFPGEQNLNVDHKVSKLILIASPVNGSSFLGYVNQMDPASKNKAYDILYKAQNINREEESLVDLKKDIGIQLPSSSEYLSDVRSSKLPPDISFFRTYVDLSVEIDYNIFNRNLYKKISFGDGVVLPTDTVISGAVFSESTLIEKTLVLDGTFDGASYESTRSLLEYPSLTHTNVPSHREVLTTVLNYLRN